MSDLSTLLGAWYETRRAANKAEGAEQEDAERAYGVAADELDAFLEARPMLRKRTAPHPPEAVMTTHTCNETCNTFPTCNVCRRRKPPIGRDVAPEMAQGMCDDDCPGYCEDPRPGTMWPGECRETREESAS